MYQLNHYKMFVKYLFNQHVMVKRFSSIEKIYCCLVAHIKRDDILLLLFNVVACSPMSKSEMNGSRKSASCSSSDCSSNEKEEEEEKSLDLFIFED